MKKILLAAAVPSLALLWAMAQAAKPTSVGYVDIVRTLQNLEQTKASEARLAELVKTQSARSDELLAEIQAVQAELESFKADTPAFNETKRKVTDALGRKRAFDEFAKRKIEAERSKDIRAIYSSMKVSVGELCKAQGVDVVMVDDATQPFDPNDPRNAMEQISSRRTLWFNPAIDLTDALIKQMNAAKPTTPAPAAGQAK